MANPIGEPDAIDNLARLYRREADRIETASASAVQALADVEWVGRRATDTRERVRSRHNEISAQVAELRSLARSLESHAQWMRATIRELENLEVRIRSWAASHPPGQGVGPDSSLIGSYPSYCSFAWRSLATRLRAAGAVF
jgi:chromosome segregation ATPase